MYMHKEYLGMPCQDGCGELNNDYLNTINQVIQVAVDDHKRVFAFRVDLRTPSDFDDYHKQHTDNPSYKGLRVTGAMTRFLESFKSIIQCDLISKKRKGKKVCIFKPRFIWCKERNQSDNYHYHVIILLNKDIYFTLGDFNSEKSMAFKVMKAWASALGLVDVNHAKRLVHFPANPSYFIDRNSSVFEKQYEELFHRVSYFAKVETKEYGNRQHNFGGSLN